MFLSCFSSVVEMLLNCNMFKNYCLFLFIEIASQDQKLELEKNDWNREEDKPFTGLRLWYGKAIIWKAFKTSNIINTNDLRLFVVVVGSGGGRRLTYLNKKKGDG